MGLIAAAVGAAGSIAGLIDGPPASNVQLPTQYQLPAGTQDTAAYGALQGTQNLPAQQYGQQFLPQYEQATQNLYNNPYASQAQQGANVAGALGQQASLNAYGQGANLQGTGQGVINAGNSLVPYASAIMQTAFDPQQALYNQTLQQTTDQQQAANAMAGVSGSPYGAGVTNTALQNFNINWQNQQLGREATGASAAQGLIGTAGSTDNTGAGIIGQGTALQGNAAGAYGQASALPYQQAQTIGQNQQSAISNLFQGGSQAQSLAQQPITDYLQYLQVGNQTNSVANQQAQTALNQANLAFNQNQTLGSNLGSSISGLGNTVNNPNSTNMNWLNALG
jgi:hypothetical protein